MTLHETSKAMIRRSYDKRYATRWLVGTGIDIGAGNDSIGNYRPMFPMMDAVRAWDLVNGDAMSMDGVADDSYDFVHSSHCLEHMRSPSRALSNWIRICKPGGYLVIMVPDEDLYEQSVWPSTFNTDHKWSFTIGKASSWSPQSINLIELLKTVVDRVAIQKIELLDTNYLYGAERFDQTMTLVGESAIEMIIQKRP